LAIEVISIQAITSVRAIATQLNERGILTGRGGSWRTRRLRVSTDKQGRSGLGLEAQRAAVESYLNGAGGHSPPNTPKQSGKRSDRPKLAKALAHAKAIGATVVFAKLDRLTRNVDLLRSLVASDVDLTFCDLPHVPPGAMGRFLLTQMASVAELEAGLISERTKAALAAAKARGVKLGNPNGAQGTQGQAGWQQAGCGRGSR
jgi:DNA invertase Pin-like site-specific DNA recombinase